MTNTKRLKNEREHGHSNHWRCTNIHGWMGANHADKIIQRLTPQTHKDMATNNEVMTIAEAVKRGLLKNGDMIDILGSVIKIAFTASGYGKFFSHDTKIRISNEAFKNQQK